MSSRRGAVKVNPVTGKMEKVDPSDVPAGKHRDGCLLVDDRYVNAAKDIGLGSEKGASPPSPSRAAARRPSRARGIRSRTPPTLSRPLLAQACTGTSRRSRAWARARATSRWALRCRPNRRAAARCARRRRR